MDYRSVTFDGLAALEITTAEARMVLVAGAGPRIAFWGRPDGDNLLYWDKDAIERDGWKLMGGHRVWVTRPLADETEDAYRPDNDPCEIETIDGWVQVTSPVDPVLRTRRGIRVRAMRDDTFEIVSFVENSGPMLYSGGVWTPTCIADPGSKEFGILLGDRTQSWDFITIVVPRAWGGHTSLVNDPQITLSEDWMVVRPAGRELKRMLVAPHGVIAMSDPQGGLSFIKQVGYDPAGQYPLACNLAVYNAPDNLFFEMETYGAQETIPPGHRAILLETWRLMDHKLTWDKPDDFLALLD
jgi:hypothetical protein